MTNINLVRPWLRKQTQQKKPKQTLNVNRKTSQNAIESVTFILKQFLGKEKNEDLRHTTLA